MSAWGADLADRARSRLSGGVAMGARLLSKACVKPVHHLIGRWHVRRGRYTRAEACFLRAVRIDPDSFAARLQLGRVYFLMQEFCEAERQFLKAQELDPKRFHKHRLPEDYACWDVMDRHEFDSIFGEFENEGSIYSFGDDSFALTDAGSGEAIRGTKGGSGDVTDQSGDDSFFADFDDTDDLFDDSFFGRPMGGEADAFAAESFSEASFDEALEPDDPEGSRFGGRPRFQGDFSSYAEWKRFQGLDPIRREELEAVDWDEIIADL